MQTYHDAGFKSEMSRPKFVIQVKNNSGKGVATEAISAYTQKSHIRTIKKVPQ